MDEDQNNGKNVSSKMPESSSKMSPEMSSKLHPRGRPKKHGSNQERWREAQRARRKRTRGDGRHAGPLAPLLSSESMEWHTPPEIWQPVLSVLGLERFDLDPCSPTRDGPIPAIIRYTKQHNGLDLPWGGVVWCNPPYGRALSAWANKATDEARQGASIILLVPARTDTQWWHTLIRAGGRPEFLQGRIRFLRPDGIPGNASPFPSALVRLSPPDPENSTHQRSRP